LGACNKDQGAEGERGRVELEPSQDEVEQEDTASAAEPLSTEVKPQRLALGDGLTCYLNNASELWCWGWGEGCPDPDPEEALPPRKQEVGVTRLSIDAYGNRLCGHTEDRKVRGRAPEWTMPPITYASGRQVDATALAVGGGFVCVQSNGTVECYG